MSLAGLGAAAGPVKPKVPRPAPLFPLEQAWTVTLPAPAVGGPDADADRVYLTLSDGALVAIARSTGETIWRAEAAASLPPVVAGGLVLTAGDAGLTAWEAETGAARWSLPFSARPLMLAPAGARVVVAGEDGHLRAWQLTDGSGAWQIDLTGLSAPPRWDGERLLAGTSDGWVYALDGATGQVRWRRQIGGRVTALVLSATRAFAGSDAHRFWALDLKTGTVAWAWRTGGEVEGAAVDGTRLYVSTLDNVLRGLEAGSGNQAWKATLTTRPVGAPVVLRELAVVAGLTPRLDGYSRKAGQAAGSLTLPAELSGPPVVNGSLTPGTVAVVAATRDGALTAFTPARLLFKDPPLAPLRALPGRPVMPEPAAR